MKYTDTSPENMQHMQDDHFSVQQRLIALKNCLDYLHIEASSKELDTECVASALEVAMLSLQKKLEKFVN